MLLTKRIAIAAHSCRATMNIFVSFRDTGAIMFNHISKDLKVEGGEKQSISSVLFLLRISICAN